MFIPPTPQQTVYIKEPHATMFIHLLLHNGSAQFRTSSCPHLHYDVVLQVCTQAPAHFNEGSQVQLQSNMAALKALTFEVAEFHLALLSRFCVHGNVLAS